MRIICRNKAEIKSIYYKEFTLIEFIVVVVGLGIIVAIAVPRYVGVIKDAKKQVCDANCLQIERMYHADLILKDSEYSEIIFSKFLNEYVVDICSDCDEIFYIDGNVKCKLYGRV